MKTFSFFMAIAIVICSCGTNYGEKISKDYLEVYYKNGITKEQAEKTIDFLYPVWKDSAETKQKSIQLLKVGDTVHFRVVYNMDVLKTTREDAFYETGNDLSENVFNGAPVNVVLTDKYFKTEKIFVFKKMDSPGFGQLVQSGNVEVFAKNFSTEKAAELGAYLDNTMKPKEVISFQATTNSDGATIVKMVFNKDLLNIITDEELEETVSGISKAVFDNKPIIFELTDTKLVTQRVYQYKGESSAMPK